MLKKTLLVCGIFSSLLYAAMTLLIPLLWKEYDSASQTVSELSAIGAPTRAVWVPLGMLYILLFAAFGWGVLKTANGNRHLRTTGFIILVYSAINLYWPPMHLRGHEMTLTDTLHIVWAGMALLLMLLLMGFGAAALGRQFRLYTLLTVAVHVVFGILTGIEGPGIAANLPTPTIGIWERINIGAFMLWVAVLAIVLLRREKTYLRSPFTSP